MEEALFSCVGRLDPSVDGEREALSLVRVYTENIYKNPTKDKFRRIRIGNERFNRVIWSHDAARELLLFGGFEQDGEFLVLPAGQDISLVLSVVCQRLGVPMVQEELQPSSAKAPLAAPTLKLSRGGSSFDQVPPDMSLLSFMQEMGFPLEASKAALSATCNAGVQPAIDWLQEHPNWQEEMLKKAESIAASVPGGAVEKFADPANHAESSRNPATSVHASSDSRSNIGDESTQRRHGRLSADVNSHPVVPSRFQKSLDARHSRQEQERIKALAAARQEKARRQRELKNLQETLEAERAGRADQRAAMTKAVLRSQGLPVNDTAVSSESQIVRNTSSVAMTSQCADDVTTDTTRTHCTADHSPVASCSVKLRLPDGRADILRLTADQQVSVLQRHVEQACSVDGSAFSLIVAHSRQELTNPSATLAEAGVVPQGIVIVQLGVQRGVLRQGQGQVSAVQPVTSFPEWRQLANESRQRHQRVLVLFYRSGDQLSEELCTVQDQLCSKALEAYSQRCRREENYFEGPPCFLKVNYDAMQVLSHQLAVVQVPEFLLLFRGTVVRRCAPQAGVDVEQQVTQWMCTYQPDQAASLDDDDESDFEGDA